MRRAPLLFLALVPSAVLAMQCQRPPDPPRGQLLVFIDTDAPIAGDPDALFDTLHVDVLPPDGTPCDACSRTFALNAASFRALAPPERGVSFGVTATGMVGYKARIRLYDSKGTLDGYLPDDLPGGAPPPSVIDHTFSLPQIPAEGVRELTAYLPTDTVGVPTQEGEIREGRPQSSKVGTWPSTVRGPCASAPKSDEVCIPGGAFWMGNARVSTNAVRRLVVVSPFFIMRTEVTVREFRASGLQAGAWSGSSSGNAIEDYCTFTPSPGPNENRPVNCVARSLARSHCASRGGDLPTEAQFEYVAGAFSSKLFVWGDDGQASCGDAVLGRAGWGFFAATNAPCRPSTPPGGSLDVGSAARDQLDVGGDRVFDLVGNVGEVARDLWNDPTEPCWSHGGVYLDPVCDTAGQAGAAVVILGGSWTDIPQQATAAERLRGPLAGISVEGGFRCVREGSP